LDYIITAESSFFVPYKKDILSKAVKVAEFFLNAGGNCISAQVIWRLEGKLYIFT
jgi:hypothetical protein